MGVGEREEEEEKEERKKLSGYIIQTLFIIILLTANPVIKGNTIIKNFKKHLYY